MLSDEKNFIHPKMSEKDMKIFGMWEDKDSGNVSACKRL